MKYLNLVTSFLPWLALGVLSSFYPPYAIPAAIALSLLSYPKLLKGFILDWASLLFFIFIFIDLQLLNNRWLAQNMSLVVSLFFVVTTLFSLLINRPFTLQYAKLEVDRKLWDSPAFIRGNQWMTAGFAVIFLAVALSILFDTYHPGFLNLKYVWGIGLITQFAWTELFPRWFRKKYLHTPKR
jgi:hypothetical protein